MKKVILVTGGANGIGKGIVKHFLQRQYQVIAADIDHQACTLLEKEFASSNLLILPNIDVSNEQHVQTMIKHSIEKFNHLDVLVNNAAIANPYMSTSLEHVSFEEWNKVMQVNINSLFLCSKYCIPFLKQTKGTIINIASTRALMSEVNTEAYSTSKGAVVAFTHSLANSVGKDFIRVNCISPGWIETKLQPQELRNIDHTQHPVQRVGTVEDIAHMVYFLSDSAQSGFITGQNFVVDGGMTKKMIYEE